MSTQDKQVFNQFIYNNETKPKQYLLIFHFKFFILFCLIFSIFLLPISHFPFLTSSAYADYWAKTYGGTSYNYAHSIQQTLDGGYIVAGWTKSFGSGDWDFWVMKLNSDGTGQNVTINSTSCANCNGFYITSANTKKLFLLDKI